MAESGTSIDSMRTPRLALKTLSQRWKRVLARMNHLLESCATKGKATNTILVTPQKKARKSLRSGKLQNGVYKNRIFLTGWYDVFYALAKILQKKCKVLCKHEFCVTSTMRKMS